jgi:hypothetical protein
MNRCKYRWYGVQSGDSVTAASAACWSRSSNLAQCRERPLGSALEIGSPPSSLSWSPSSSSFSPTLACAVYVRKLSAPIRSTCWCSVEFRRGRYWTAAPVAFQNSDSPRQPHPRHPGKRVASTNREEVLRRSRRPLVPLHILRCNSMAFPALGLPIPSR